MTRSRLTDLEEGLLEMTVQEVFGTAAALLMHVRGGFDRTT